MAEREPFPSDDELLNYLAGRSSDTEARRIADAAAGNPDLRAEIALMQAARGVLETETEETSPGDFGWARLSRAIDAEAGTVSAGLPSRGRSPVWLVAASAAIAAVALWQVVAVPLLPSRGGVAPGYVTATDPVDAALVLTVAFVPTATEAQIRTLLREAGAEVIGGPSALGLWRLRFPDAASRDAAENQLAAAATIVESVQSD